MLREKHVEPSSVKIWAEKSQRFHENFADSKESITFLKSSFVLVKRIHEKSVLESSSTVAKVPKKIEVARVIVGQSECRIHVCIVTNSISRNIFEELIHVLKQCLKRHLLRLRKLNSV